MDQEKIEQFRQQQAQQAAQDAEEAKHQEVVGSLNNLLLATMVSKDPKMVEVAQNLAELLGKIGEASQSFEGSSLHLLPIANQELALSVQDLADRIEQYSPHDLAPYFEALVQQLDAISQNKPVVNVPKQPVTVDLKPLISALDEVKKAVAKNKIDIPKTDMSDVIKGLKDVQKTINGLTFPVPNYVLPFSQDGKAAQVALTTDGKVPVDATISAGDIEIGAVEIKDGTLDTRTSVVAGDADQNPMLAAPARKEVTFSTTSVAAVGATDVSNYASVSVHISSQGGSSTVTFQGSNDNTNWVSVGLLSSASVGGTVAAVSSTATGIFNGSLPYRYFRLNVTGIVSGTTAGTIEFKSTPLAPNVMSTFMSAMSASTTGPMKAEDAASATLDQGIAAMAIRRDTPVANDNVSADGDYTQLKLDNFGKLWTAQSQVEDAAHATGDRGSFILGVRNDTNASMTTTDGDYSPLAVNTGGALAIQDGGNSITVDAASLPLPTGAATAALQTQPGVDIGDVTINNASGAAAVNVQDGGNSLTVDGTVTADTELPAAAALSDSDGNPTTPTVGAALLIWDGQNSLLKRARTAPSTATTTLIGTQVQATAPTVYGAANTLRVQGSSSVIGDANTGTTMAAVSGMAYNGTTWDIVRSGAQSNVAAATGYLANLGIGQYNATAPTLTDTRYNHLQLDSKANLKTVEGAVEVATMFNAILNDVDISVKASAGYLKSIAVTSINAGLRYLQVHNKATAPAGGDTPIWSFPIPAGAATAPAMVSFGEQDWGSGGLSCSTGIAIGVSTTAATFTAATTTDHVVTGMYV